MKSFSFFLLLVFIAALITEPGHEKFNKYLAKNGKNTGTCLGGTRHQSYKVFSLDYVDYCEVISINSSNSINTNIGINKKIKTDKYLGLFGTFWKL
jgi:hypothetical protein